MRIVVFILSLVSLIYVPTKFCVSIGCALRDYEFLFNISDRHQIDIERLVIQFLILAILFISTYSNLYNKIVLKIKKIETEEEIIKNFTLLKNFRNKHFNEIIKISNQYYINYFSDYDDKIIYNNLNINE